MLAKVPTAEQALVMPASDTAPPAVFEGGLATGAGLVMVMAELDLDFSNYLCVAHHNLVTESARTIMRSANPERLAEILGEKMH